MADIKAIAEALVGMTTEEVQNLAKVLNDEYGITAEEKVAQTETGMTFGGAIAALKQGKHRCHRVSHWGTVDMRTDQLSRKSGAMLIGIALLIPRGKMKRSARPLNRLRKQVHPKPRALCPLCGEERLGGVRKNVRGHTLPVVRYRHADTPVSLAQRDAKMLRFGAQRVLSNVEKM